MHIRDIYSSGDGGGKDDDEDGLFCYCRLLLVSHGTLVLCSAVLLLHVMLVYGAPHQF